ncbi:hypothetical protein PAXINDRAFT_172257, partial [Paxillus involutus ATCC 200175]
LSFVFPRMLLRAAVGDTYSSGNDSHMNGVTRSQQIEPIHANLRPDGTLSSIVGAPPMSCTQVIESTGVSAATRVLLCHHQFHSARLRIAALVTIFPALLSDTI